MNDSFSQTEEKSVTEAESNTESPEVAEEGVQFAPIQETIDTQTDEISQDEAFNEVVKLCGEKLNRKQLLNVIRTCTDLLEKEQD